MAKYSFSVITVWNISAYEAQNGCSIEIDPEHILLGFLKLSEVNLDDIFAGTNPVEF